MHLQLQSSFLSITEFPKIELPKFTLITGVNGVGKTHLLRAIESGKIKIDIAPNHEQDIRFFDWNSLLPNDTGRFDGHKLLQQRENIYTKFEQQTQRSSDLIVNAARSAGVSGEYLSNPQRLAMLTPEDLKKILNIDDSQQIRQAHKSIQNAVDNASRNVLAQLKRDPAANQILNQLSLGLTRGQKTA